MHSAAAPFLEGGFLTPNRKFPGQQRPSYILLCGASKPGILQRSGKRLLQNENSSASLKKAALEKQENREEGRSGSWTLLTGVELDTNSCSSLSKRKSTEPVQATHYSSGSFIHLFSSTQFHFFTVPDVSRRNSHYKTSPALTCPLPHQYKRNQSRAVRSDLSFPAHALTLVGYWPKTKQNNTHTPQLVTRLQSHPQCD